MSNINKQALREAAEKATPGNWWIDSHGQAMVSFIDNDVLEVFATDNKRAAVRHEDTGNLSRWRNDNDATFIATANPATVLALLDELEAAQSYAKERDEENQDLMLTVGRLRVERETSEAEMDNALCELLPGVQYMDPPDGGNVTPLEQVRRMVADYRERIAELEVSHSNLREAMAGIHNTITDGGAYTPLAAIMNAAKLAYDESAAAAGIITKVGE
ncbi:MAG: ead/Ea22-like family protein [Leclercia adecarboxylata]|nr:ead/Ea22-like family protein [Leclercia adecarboxylata]